MDEPAMTSKPCMTGRQLEALLELMRATVHRELALEGGDLGRMIEEEATLRSAYSRNCETLTGTAPSISEEMARKQKDAAHRTRMALDIQKVMQCTRERANELAQEWWDAR